MAHARALAGFAQTEGSANRGKSGYNLSNMLPTFSLAIVSMTSSGGVPNSSVIMENWLTSINKHRVRGESGVRCQYLRSFPGNNGLPSSISANIQPVLQMSTATSYFCQVNIISGAR